MTELYTDHHASALDAADPLRHFRDEFHLPLHDGAPQAYFVGNSPELLAATRGTWVQMIIIFAPLAIVFFGFNPVRMSSNALRVSFIALSVCYGLSFGYIFAAFTGESIAKTFFVATAMFAGLSLIGYTTKKDLSAFGSFMIMGVWGLLALSLINIGLGVFMPS